MKYLFIGEDGGLEARSKIDKDEVANVVDGYLTIIRWEKGEFQEFTPIDETDTDNWSKILGFDETGN